MRIRELVPETKEILKVFERTPPDVAVYVTVCADDAFTVKVTTPLVVDDGEVVIVLEPVPVNVTESPLDLRFVLASLRVTVTVAVELPSATTEDELVAIAESEFEMPPMQELVKETEDINLA